MIRIPAIVYIITVKQRCNEYLCEIHKLTVYNEQNSFVVRTKMESITFERFIIKFAINGKRKIYIYVL